MESARRRLPHRRGTRDRLRRLPAPPPRFTTENLAANTGSYSSLRGIAADLGITPSQLALAWLLHQDPYVVPIPGSHTPAHIEENLAAARVTLHPDTLALVDGVLRRLTPSGGTLLDDEREA